MRSKILLSFIFIITSIFSSDAQQSGTGRLLPLPLGSISIEGELLQRLNANFDRLEKDKYLPENFFKTEEESGYWPGDSEGRTLLAWVLEWKATKRKPLYIDTIMHIWPLRLNEKGYFGTIYPAGTADEQQLSSHGWVLRGLCEYYLFTRDSVILDYIRRVAENLVLPTAGLHRVYPVDPDIREHAGSYIGSRQVKRSGAWILSTDIGCDFIFLDGVVQAFQVLGDERLRPVIREIIDLYNRIDLVRIKAQTHASLTGMRALLRYYESTKDDALLDTVIRRFDQYKKNAMTENHENYNWFGRPEWTEPCGIIDSYLIAMQLWSYTRDAQYLADAHLIYYNALCHDQHNDGSFSCSSCSGARDPFVKPLVEDVTWCCNMRGGEGLSKAAEYTCFISPYSICFVNYRDCRVKTEFHKKEVQLKQTTSYPFRGAVTIEVESSDYKGESLNFTFFAPPWGSDFMVSVNSLKQDVKVIDQMVTLSILPKKGDKIEFTFSQSLRTEEPFNINSLKGYQKFYIGPLLIGADIRDEHYIEPGSSPSADTGDFSIKVKGQYVKLTPVYHLLDPKVSIGQFYCKQVMFRKE